MPVNQEGRSPRAMVLFLKKVFLGEYLTKTVRYVNRNIL